MGAIGVPGGTPGTTAYTESTSVSDMVRWRPNHRRLAAAHRVSRKGSFYEPTGLFALQIALIKP